MAALTTDPHGRILLVRKQTSQMFMQPGGKPEPGEDSLSALRRELQEELQVDVPASALSPVGEFETDTANEPGHVLHSQVFRLHLDQPVTASAEIAEARWFTLDEADALGDRLAPLARKLLPRLAAPRLRESVRALILDERDKVLLVRFQFGPARFWANPGGGIEAGEDRLTALQRELREEVGLDVDTLGPEVWTKTAYFPMNGCDGQVDHIHLVRTSHFTPKPEFTDQQLRDEGVQEIRWWSVDEILNSTEVFAPRALRELLPDVLRRVPDQPLTIAGF
ncbi:NUDIX domain-containing protein [Branchiibius cervicis]|uniref:NUDIX domain-containing protein n=1 Tax=Branchiibius cervicis TaxID=908252 RepID=A0ABW2AYH0_9MICO